MMRNSAFLLLAAALLLGACSVAPSDQVTEIPAIVFLTGSQAPLGEEVEAAFALAQSDLAREGYLVEVTLKDSQDIPSQALSAFYELLRDDPPLVLVTGDAVTEALAPVAAERGVVLLSTVAASHDVREEWLFRGFFTAREQGSALAVLADSDPGIKTVSVLRLNNVFSHSLVQSFRDDLVNAEILSEEQYGIADGDVRSQLLKIREQDPDAVLVSGFGPTYPVIFTQMRELGMDQVVLADASLSIPFFYAAAGDEELDDIFIITADFSAETPGNARAEEFVRRYRERTGQEPSFAAAFAYETLMLAAEGLRCGDEAIAVRTCLQEIRRDGLFGPVYFDDENDLNVPLVINRVEEGVVSRAYEVHDENLIPSQAS